MGTVREDYKFEELVADIQELLDRASWKEKFYFWRYSAGSEYRKQAFNLIEAYGLGQYDNGYWEGYDEGYEDGKSGSPHYFQTEQFSEPEEELE